MAHRVGAQRARPVRRVPRLAKFIFAAVIFSAGYGALTGNAVGPGFGEIAMPDGTALPITQLASIAYTDTDVIITGAIDHVFEAGAFVGPNRATKTDRQRISIDAADFTAGFEIGRTELAALRVPGTPDVQLAAVPIIVAPAAVAVAALDPEVIANSSALDAIASLAPDQIMPMVPSQQLAYARELAPPTPTTLSPEELATSDRELWCLATAIYFEARGESYRGQIGVAQVVMNRVAHKLYPNTICGVVFQNSQKRNACQFSFACDGIPETIKDKKSWQQAEDIARGVVGGTLYLPEVANATHYHANYVYPYWAPRLKKLTTIDHHIFYTFKRA
ncbi:MAG: cell wall hydrolase [Devosia sp.]|nr:cell wall hydrolase [Devosia sp.]